MFCCNSATVEFGAKQASALVPLEIDSQPTAFSFAPTTVYKDADLSWLDKCNCFRCESCGKTAALGYTVCPRCGGPLTALLVPDPPAPRNRDLEPDNGFECFECGLLWKRNQLDGCPACGGILLPIRVSEDMLP